MSKLPISTNIDPLIHYADFLTNVAELVSCTTSHNRISALILHNGMHYRDGGFALSARPDGENHFDVTRHDIHGNWLGTTSIVSKINFHFAIWLSDTELLMVCVRSQDRLDRNAVVFDHHGNILRQFYIGDAIADVKVDYDGNIWISYFDEGISSPISEYGLVCFSQKGEVLWHHDQSDDQYMLDCYALNIDDENNVWYYAYPDFTLYKIAPGKRETAYDIDNDGAHFLNVQGDFIFMSGGYGDNKLYLSELSLTKQIQPRKIQLNIASKTSKLNAKHYVSCDQFNLTFLCDNVLYLLNMNELIAHA